MGSELVKGFLKDLPLEGTSHTARKKMERGKTRGCGSSLFSAKVVGSPAPRPLADVSAKEYRPYRISFISWGLPLDRTYELVHNMNYKEMTAMPTEKPRYTVIVDEKMLKEIDDFRFENRYPSRSAATLELIRLGMKQLKMEQEKGKESLKPPPSGGETE